MKILLAPSESKNAGGNSRFDIGKLSFDESLGALRAELWDKYLSVFKSGDEAQICALTGLKKPEIFDFSTSLEAILRYSGVAYDYLDYGSLDKDAKDFLEQNLLIFSNLFGVLKPNDKVPCYKLKQGEKCAGIEVANYYKSVLSAVLDKYLQNDEILDLRAGFYEKFYVPSKEYIVLKFIKGGKVVSHFAKAYRGLVLRYIAMNACGSFDEFLALKIPDLKLLEITKIKNKITYSFEISQN